MNPVERAARAAWKPRDPRKSWEWCEDHVYVDRTSPLPGKWRSANSPWVREVMEAADDKRITFIGVRCSAQSSKTQTILNMLCHDVSEDPGPEMYVLANKEDAEDFVRDRVSPMFAQCQPVRDLILKERKLSFTFRTMPLYFVGAGSPAKLQGKPIKRLKLDEVRNYPPGAYETVLKRVRAFGELAQVFVISTPANKGDAVDRAFTDGDQRVFHFPCPECQQLQPLKFAQLKWEKNEVTKPNGVWNFDELAKTIFYECAHCSHRITDTHVNRKFICRAGHFIRMNPNAPANHVSFTWNALLPWWVKWRSIVQEFLAARNAIRLGDLEPMRTFVNETLGEPWEDQLGVIEDFGFLDDRAGDYDFGEPWAEEITRFIAADKQAKGGEHYWWVIRAFGAYGKSRLIGYGRCNSLLELEEIRKQHNVPVKNTIIDSGYKANEVYRFCAATGWKPFKGDDAEYFLHKDKRTGKTYRQCWQAVWAQPEGVKPTPGMPRRVRLFRWSNPWVKDLLAEFYTGLVGEWTIVRQVGREYGKQLTAERREEFQDTRGRLFYRWVQKIPDNHILDCELMIKVAAVITKLIVAKRTVIETETTQ